MDFTVSVQGPDPKAFQAAGEAIARELNKALFASAKQVESVAKKSILAGGKSGRIYRRRTVIHQASAPGEAPASDTGRLVNSINSYLDSTSLTSFVVAGRGTAQYAALLEFGTRKMAPRPFLFPALEASKGFIGDRLADAVKRGVAASGKA